jgi:hypothetical protein
MGSRRNQREGEKSQGKQSQRLVQGAPRLKKMGWRQANRPCAPAHGPSLNKKVMQYQVLA